MASSINGPGTAGDEIRYKSYLAQMERDQDATLKDKDEIHKERINHLVTSHDQQTEQMKKDYDVKISAEAESLDQKLLALRERNTARVNLEKENGEAEATKVHRQYEQKLELEHRNGDEQIAKLQNYYKKASEELQKQYEKDRSRTVQKGKPA